MHFAPTPWWEEKANWNVPEGVQYLCERWWELLGDRGCITAFSPRTSYLLSLLEDVSDIIEDMQAGKMRSCYQLDMIKDELVEILNAAQSPVNKFPSEVASVKKAFDDLYDKVKPDPQDRYSELKKRHAESRRAAMAARRLHHRCLRRRVTAFGTTWVGLGGMMTAELIHEIVESSPNYNKIDRLINSLMLDCLYRGHELGYLKDVFERYLPREVTLSEGILHAFRRIHSPKQHDYTVLFVLRGATAIEVKPGEPEIQVHSRESVERLVGEPDSLPPFLEQYEQEFCSLISIKWSKDRDSGAAATGARKALQEVVDYLDFRSPSQRLEIAPITLVDFADSKGIKYTLSHSNEFFEHQRRGDFKAEIEPQWVNQLKGLSEAFRWSAVARREKTPEVSLLAAWFAFEYLAGDIGKSPVETIMEYFPRTLALGDLKRRLLYWIRSVENAPAFARHSRSKALSDKAYPYKEIPNYSNIMALLLDSMSATPGEDGAAVQSIAKSSVLLRERTAAEAKLFSNNQMLAQALSEGEKTLRQELSRFLLIRNKLVHRARIDHPLLVVVSERANRRLYDLLRDISGQLTEHRLTNSVHDILNDYRDTYDELLVDLGKGAIPPDFIDRILLS